MVWGLSHIEALTNAQTIEELWGLHTEKMKSFGFDRLIYGFTRYRSGGSLGDPQDWVVLTNHSEVYMSRFIGEGYVFNAPMVHWALENNGACSWSWLQEVEHLTAEERKIVAFNRKHDVTAGYTISFRSVSSRTKGAAAITARSGLTQDDVDRIWKENGPVISTMSNVVYLKMLTLPYATRNLTDRQREVLQWVGDGKTTQDIAQIMGLTLSTVEKHLRLAREALEVETTAQAVLKASFYNQMFIIDNPNIAGFGAPTRDR